MEFRNVDTVRLGGGKIVVGFLNGPRQGEVPSFGRRRRRQVPPKRQFLQEPNGVTTQKTPFFIVTGVKTSNLTCSVRLPTG
jgi:hypothetical protein